MIGLNGRKICERNYFWRWEYQNCYEKIYGNSGGGYMPQMKILIIRNYPSYMDVKHNTYNIQEVGLAKALTKIGHQCDVLFWTNKEEETVYLECNGKKVYIYYKNGRTILKNTVFCGCDVLFSSYDILQPCEYNQLESWYLASKYPSKTVVYHGPYYSKFNKRYNLMCKAFDVVFLRRYKRLNTPFIVKSNLARDFLLQKGINNITVAGVGIDQSVLNTQEITDESNFHRQMEVDRDCTKVLYVGRLERRRNILFLLDIFHLLSEKIENIKFYIIGSGEREYTENVWKRVDELGLQNYIRYEEKLEQKYLSAIYKEADYFILPTEYEIFGMVLLEAMNYETVCVTNTNGGSSMLIKNGENGLIIDEMDSKRWADAIANLINNPGRMMSIKAVARKTIQDGFTWNRIIPLFENKYKELID